MGRQVDLVARRAHGRSGVGRYAAALAAALAALGLDIRLAPTTGALSPVIGRLGRTAGVDLAAFLASYPPLVATRPGALVHVTAQTFATMLWLQPGGVVTVHDLFPEDRASGLRRPIIRIFEAAGRLAMRRAHAVLTDSQEIAGICGRRGLGRRFGVTVVRPGVDHTVFRPHAVPPAFRRRLGVPDGAPVLLYVGTEAPRKRVHLLLHLLARLRRGGFPEAVLLKVGAPHYRERRSELRALAEALDIGGAIGWLDGVTEEELAWLYNLASVYVSASAQEGFGLPVLEALASGCSVAVTDIGAHREIVGDAGVLLPPDGVEAWPALVGRLVGDAEQRRSLARCGVERAAPFTWQRAAEQTLAVYQRVAGW